MCALIFDCQEAEAAFSIALDVRKKDREANLATVVGEVEMEEDGGGAKLFRSKASRPFCVSGSFCVKALSI